MLEDSLPTMYLRIQQPDEQSIAFFGVSDFRATSEDTVEVWFPTSSNLAGDERRREVEGTVVESVDEAYYNREGAYETIGDIGVDSDTSLTVVNVPEHPHVAQAAKQLSTDSDYRGNFEMIAL